MRAWKAIAAAARDPRFALGLSAAGLGGLAILIALDGAGWLEALAGAAVLGGGTAGLIASWAWSRAPAPAQAGRMAADSDASAAKVVELLPQPVLVVRRNGRIAAANAAARAELGLARENMLLSSVLREPVVLEAVNEVLAGAGAPVAAGYMALAPRERHVRVFAAPLAGEGGRPADRAMLMLTDETAVKRAERARLDFLANASHELRTPLASLAGFIETLRGHARDDAEARDRFLGIMAAQAARMQRLINDLLSLSRIELNEHVPPTGVADLIAVAGDVADALAPVAAQAGVRIELDRQVETAPVLGDREQLLQAVQNLIDNAVKFSPAGEVVRVTAGAGAGLEEAIHPLARLTPEAGPISLLIPEDVPGARFAWLHVRDHGPGVARRHLPRLSERFFRVGEPADPARAGTGLGLAIVKHVMSRHRGGLAVESAPGRGTAFILYAPQTLDAADPTPRDTAEPAPRPPQAVINL